MLMKTDFDDLRSLQTELSALDVAEKERVVALDEARARAGNMENSLRSALSDPRSSWETISNLDRDLSLVRMTITSLNAQADAAAQEKAEALRRTAQEKVASMLGLAVPGPEPDAVVAEPVTSSPGASAKRGESSALQPAEVTP